MSAKFIRSCKFPSTVLPVALIWLFSCVCPHMRFEMRRFGIRLRAVWTMVNDRLDMSDEIAYRIASVACEVRPIQRTLGPRKQLRMELKVRYAESFALTCLFYNAAIWTPPQHPSSQKASECPDTALSGCPGALNQQLR